MFLTVGHASLLRFLLVRPTLYLFHSYIVQLFSSLGCVLRRWSSQGLHVKTTLPTYSDSPFRKKFVLVFA